MIKSEGAEGLASGNKDVAESIQQAIARQVSAWPGVTTGPHRFGGIEFRLGRRELGHLHGNRLADLPFPLLVREQLVAAGQAEPHHVYPESGWVSYFIGDAADVARVVALFRLNYDRPWVHGRGPSPAWTGIVR